MARDDEAREVDETSVIAGGNQAWSTVDQPAQIRPSGDAEPAAEYAGSWQQQSEDDAPTTTIPTVLDSDPGPYVDADQAQEPGTGGIPRAAIGPGGRTDSDGERAGGPTPPAEPPAPVLVAAGLGLLTNASIDQHFIVRSRYNRLLSAIAKYPDLTCIGIDEATAIIVTGNQVKVVGESQVVVMKRPVGLKVTDKGLIKMKDLSFSIYTSGDSFDLGK